MTSSTLNPTVLEPLFAPWQEPNAHRVRAEKSGDRAVVKQGQRASPIAVVVEQGFKRRSLALGWL